MGKSSVVLWAGAVLLASCAPIVAERQAAQTKAINRAVQQEQQGLCNEEGHYYNPLAANAAQCTALQLTAEVCRIEAFTALRDASKISAWSYDALLGLIAEGYVMHQCGEGEKEYNITFVKAENGLLRASAIVRVAVIVKLST